MVQYVDYSQTNHPLPFHKDRKGPEGHSRLLLTQVKFSTHEEVRGLLYWGGPVRVSGGVRGPWHHTGKHYFVHGLNLANAATAPQNPSY